MRRSRTVGAGLLRIGLALAALAAAFAVVPAAASAQDDQPPWIGSANFSPADVPNTGGTVTVTAFVLDAIGTIAPNVVPPTSA